MKDFFGRVGASVAHTEQLVRLRVEPDKQATPLRRSRCRDV